MQLTKRMQAIFDLVERCQLVADVGCDHGKIGVQLILDKICSRCIFSDISIQSLEKAKLSCTELNLTEKTEFIVSSGFENYDVKKQIDYAIISGMGGIEITSIVLNTPPALNIKHFILQPNNNVVYLKRNLVRNGYKILYDAVVENGGKFYFLLKIVLGQDVLTRDEYEFGRTNLQTYPQDFIKWLESKLEKLLSIYNQVAGSEKEVEIYDLIKKIKFILKGRGRHATRN